MSSLITGGSPISGGGGSGGAGGGVTGSSDSSLSISGSDATINRATAGAWTAAHTFTTSSVPVTSTITDASAATQIEGLRLRHQSSTAATVGIGVYQSFWASNNVAGGGTLAEAARIHGILRGVTNGSEAGVILFQHNVSGVMTNVGHTANGGFYGATTMNIGTVNATGVTTTLAQWSIASSMLNHASSSAAQGGHSFTGIANTSGARSFFVITPSSNTGSTAATEVKIFDYQTHTHQFASNTAVATQREFSIAAPTYAFATAGGTISDAATLYVSAAPIAGTNATITRGYSLWTDDGDVRHDNIGVALGGGSAATLGTIGGSGPATATQNKWARLNIDGTNYFIPVWV